MNVTCFTVHASATRPSLDVGVKEIRQWHLDRGWRDVGYHYVIRRDGTIEGGRPDNQVGAHVGNHNTWRGGLNLGICMVGGVKQSDGLTPEDNFTNEQFRSLEALLTELHHQWPDAELKGHNEFPGHASRGCPCFDIGRFREEMYRFWANLRA